MIQISDPKQWAELCAAFDSLVELDVDARGERLVAIGASDPAARRALEELLDADANSASSLDRIDAIFGAVDPLSERERSADRDVLKLVGQTVAHFRVIEPLAAGGMGVVYRAIDTQLGRPVALKFPLPGQHVDRNVRERFLREARAAGALDHSNICSIYETGQTEDGQLFLAMPLYEGETLKARIARAGPLPIADAIGIALQVAHGLHAAHRAGIIHRDLKPANVIIVGDGGLKILDFGVARMGDVTLTKSHDALGTVPYMSPEQVRGVELDGRADLWALGVLLYEMLTGHRPFEGEQEIPIVNAILHANPVRPSVLRPEISPELDALVLALLAREPNLRPASAEAVAAQLTVLQSRSPPPKVRRSRRTLTARDRRRAAVLGSTIVLIVAAAGVTAWLRRAPPASGSAVPRIVAVLPFENITGRDDADYLTVALPDEIRTRLSRLNAVTVSDEESALKYRGSRKPLMNIASETGAGAVVRGRVQRTGDEVRLEIDLFDLGQKHQVVTREYRGPVNSVLDLQRSATEGIVGALHLDMTPGERGALMQVPTRSPEAYDLYLRGRAAHIGAAFDHRETDDRDRWHTDWLSSNVDVSPRQVESLQRAQSYYARARENDPNFAAVRASLAMSHLALAGNDRMSARRDQARLEAEAALRLEPGMPEAHEALASYWLLGNDPSNAIGELQRALAGRPNAPDLYMLLASNLRRVGRLEEAVNAFERASRLDPRDKNVHREAAMTYSRLRRYDEAIAHWDRLLAIDPRDGVAQIIRGYAYLRRGDVDSLAAAVNRVPNDVDAGWITYAHYTVHRIRRRNAEALAGLDSARAAPFKDGFLYLPIPLMRAQTLQRMGELARARSNYDAARVFLEDSVAAHPRDPRMHIALGLAYAGLNRRADARRQALLATQLVHISDNSPAAAAFTEGAVEIYAQLGDVDRALELIEILLTMPAGREVSPALLRLDPTFDPLRSDPRFEALISRFSRN